MKCFYGDISGENISPLLLEYYQYFDKALLLYNTIEGIIGRSNRIRALRNINSMLKEGGKLILSIHNRFWVNWIRPVMYLNIKRALLKLQLQKELTIIDKCIATSEFNSIIIKRPHTVYPWYIYSLFELERDLKKAGFSIERVFLTEDDNPFKPRIYEVFDEVNYETNWINRARIVLRILNTPKYYVIARKIEVGNSYKY